MLLDKAREKGDMPLRRRPSVHMFIANRPIPLKVGSLESNFLEEN